jgi:N-acyl-L-homoserine lactone synthetase
MIDVFNMETAHHLGDSLHTMFQVRYRVFIERRHYEVPHLREMEWDEFDTPAAVYFLGRDRGSGPCAVGRMIPTTFPYMISSLWPELAGDGRLPSRPDVWEISRVGVERRLRPAARRRYLGGLICAFAEFGLRNNVTSFLVVSHESLIHHNLIDIGWRVDVLGAPRLVGQFPVVAAQVHLDPKSLRASYDAFGLAAPLMRLAGDTGAEAKPRARARPARLIRRAVPSRHSKAPLAAHAAAP